MSARSKNLQRKSKVRRQRDPIPWKYCLLTLVCGLILVAGFFYAARLHFSSMDYGMKNAKLRKQIDELTSEKRRHELLREIALTPAQIKKAAQKLGLSSMSARNIENQDSKRSDQKVDEESTQKEYKDVKKTNSSAEVAKDKIKEDRDSSEKSKKKKKQIEIKKTNQNKPQETKDVTRNPKMRVAKNSD